MDRTPDVSGIDFANLLLESVAYGVFTINDAGEIASWNPFMEKLPAILSVKPLEKPAT